MLILFGLGLNLKDDPRRESRRKGTQKASLCILRTNDIATQRSFAWWAERQTFSDSKRRNPLPEAFALQMYKKR
jgi:hypothetical protein